MYISPRSSSASRPFLLIVTSLLGACASSRTISCGTEPRVLEVVHVSNGPAPIVTHLEIGEETLEFREEGGDRYCRRDPDAARKLRAVFAGTEVKQVLSEIRRSPERFHRSEDTRAVVIATGGQIADIDFALLPQVIDQAFGDIDKEFGRIFGRRYRNILSK
jgi:hypothetical protein